MKSSEVLVWIDCEMTGLDVAKDELVEVAVVVTDSNLEVLDPGISVVIKPSANSLDNMSDFVKEMHLSSGLLDDIQNGVELEQAETKILEYLAPFVVEARTAPLAGNSIGTDRMFLNKYMPQLDAFLHYRNIDVSSVKELARRWYPKTYFQLPKKTGGHRALADIKESIAELRYYRATIFTAEPGLSSEAAKEIADKLGKPIE